MPLRYTGIRVTDLKKSVRFYTKALGLHEAMRGDLREYGLGIWVLLEDPETHQRLELNWYPPRSNYATKYVPGDGLDHIGFLMGRVPAARLEVEYRRLLRAGAKPTEVTPKRTQSWAFDVKDPDGNWIEVFRHPTLAEERKITASRPSKRKKSR
jgi:catechol 2,3-dioxygenase-like lactoylglutathione lyase family enzyme